MPCWYYDKRELRHTPSIKAGLTVDQETLYRREGARFILQVGNKMGLRYETMASGVVFFHRFYMVHSFQAFPRHVTACCCLFLAGKVEETPKKCRDIMKTAKMLMKEDTWAEFGTDAKEEVMTLERIILQTIKFDFIVEHPYSYLLKYAKCLKGDKKKLQNMVQMAWTFVNDSLCTTLCLQWEAEIIAIALMYLAGKLSKFEVTDWSGRSSRHSRWWDMFTQGITTDLLEDICHQVLDLYAPNKAETAAAAQDVKNRQSSATSAATNAPGTPSSAQPQNPPQQQKQLAPPPQQTTPPSQVPNSGNGSTSSVPSSVVVPAAAVASVTVPQATIPAAVPGKDEPSGDVPVSDPSAGGGQGAAASAAAGPYASYYSAYPGYNPSYPPPPAAGTPTSYRYAPYQAPPTQTPPVPPAAAHYPPPLPANTQAPPPPSPYTPYSTTPRSSHAPPTYRNTSSPYAPQPPPPSSLTSGPPPPHGTHPYPQHTQHPPPPPSAPYYPSSTPYSAPQSGHYSYYGSGS